MEEVAPGAAITLGHSKRNVPFSWSQKQATALCEPGCSPQQSRAQGRSWFRVNFRNSFW